MTGASTFEIRRYEFDSRLINQFEQVHYVKDLWPVVYILSDGTINEAYIGETTDTYSRMSNHLKSSSKSKLTSLHLISREKFNKSATLDIESNLIRYISGDGQYKLLNANIGLAHHNYYQKQIVYWGMFQQIWDKLRAEGIAKHSIEYINNSDLFKYSPYKVLSKDQKDSLLIIMRNLLSGDFDRFIIEGGAGTGKTILAIFLFKLIYTDNSDFSFKEFGEDEKIFVRLVRELKIKYPKPKMALVVPMASFRATLKKIFRNIKGLTASMVVGPAEISKQRFDIIVVDESHRLRRRVNLGTYFGAFDKACNTLKLDKNKCSELDWVLQQSDKTILFYDEGQSIKPSDADTKDFEKLKKNRNTKIQHLKSQLRIRGGNDYIEYVDCLLDCELDEKKEKFVNKEYEFLLFDSLEEMAQKIRNRDQENGLSRLIAGYSWEWVSKNDPKLFDIKVDDFQLKWNSVSVDWINSDDSIYEAGCIHTTQGYDLNYAGIIFGNEITFNSDSNRIEILEQNYFDKNGKQSIKDPNDLKHFILNIYKTILKRGIKGTYVYACDKKLYEYLANFIPRYKQPAVSLVQSMDKIEPFVNAIPLYNLKAAAGVFGKLQNIDDLDWVRLPENITPDKDLFACQVFGESMNKIIPNGSICLFRKYSGGSRNGQIVLVEMIDFQDLDSGSSFSVKEYESKKIIDEEGWKHESIILRPISSDIKFKEIVLSEGEINSFKIVATFECLL